MKHHSETPKEAGDSGFLSNDRLYWRREAATMLENCGLDYLAQSPSQTAQDVLDFAERYAKEHAAPGWEEVETEQRVYEALCCPTGCVRDKSDCWRTTTAGSKKIVPAIMGIIRSLTRPAGETGQGAVEQTGADK